MGRVISAVIQFVDAFTRPSQEAINSMRRIGNEAVKAGKQIQNAGRTIAGAGATLTKSVTLPIAGVATAALKMSNDFENAMAKVGTIADTANTPMTALKEQVIDLSNAVGVGVADIAEAQYQAISAGVDTAASVDFVSTAVKAAKGGFTDAATAVDGLTTVLNAYGFEAGKAAEISDQMLLAQNFGKTSFGDMASSMGKVIPIASSLNVSTEELFGSIAVLTKNGIATSEAITGLKAAYSNILKPSADASKTAQQLGLDFSSAHLKSAGWAKFLDEIKEKTAGNTETMAKLFGSTEALNSVTVLAGKGSADFAKVLGQMGDAAGMTQAAYEKMLTPTERMNISLNKVKNSLIQFGVALTPVFDKAAEIIGKAGDKLNSLSEGQVNAIVKFAAIAGAIGPALLAFGKIVTVVGKAHMAFGTVMKTIANFGGIAKMIASPAGIVIGILAAIAFAAVLIIKNWDKVKTFLQKVGNWFKDAFAKAGFSVSSFKDKFSSIANTIGGITRTIGEFCVAIADVFAGELAGDISDGAAEAGGALQELAGGVAVAFDRIVGAVDTGLQVFHDLLSFLTGAFRGDWDGAVRDLKNSISNIFPPDVAEDIKSALDNILPVIKAVTDGAKKAFNGLLPDLKRVAGDLKETFGGVGTFFKGVFSGDTEMMFDGLKETAEGIADTIGSIVTTGINEIKNFVTGALGNFLPEETINKIEAAFDGVAKAWDTAVGIAKDVLDGFLESVKPILDDVKAAFGGVTKFLESVFSGDWKGALDGLKEIADSALSGLVDIIKTPFRKIRNIVGKAADKFHVFDNVKSILSDLGNKVKDTMAACGIDIGKFGEKISDIKERAVSIGNNIKDAFDKIGETVKKVAGIIAEALGIKTADSCSKAGASFAEVKEAVASTFSKIKEIILPVVDAVRIKVAFAFGAVKGVIAAAVDTITSLIDDLARVFDGITNFVSGVFTGNWEKAWEGVKDIFGGVFDALKDLCKTPLNAVIGLINGAIDGINNLGIKVPDWVPLIGGKDFSINIPPVPLLYKGTDNWKGGMAVIHDRGGEIVDLPQGSRVYPHDKSVEMARRDGAAQGKTGSVVINIQKLADKIEVRSDEDIDRIAEALAYKLKKVAFNTGCA